MESDKNFPWVPACEKSAHRILLLRNNSYCSLRQMSAVWYGKHPSRLGHRHLAKNIQRKGFNPRGSMGMVYLPIHEWLVFMIDRLVRNIHSFHGSVMGMNWMMLNLPFVYRKLIICGCFGAPCNEIRKPLGIVGVPFSPAFKNCRKRSLEIVDRCCPSHPAPDDQRAIEKSGKSTVLPQQHLFNPDFRNREVVWWISLMILEASYNQ